MYIITDNCGMPQCGTMTSTPLASFGISKSFLDDNPVIMERIREQYAFISEV